MNKYNIKHKEAMKLLMDCPKIISTDLDKFMKEVIFLFELYHKMSERDTIRIFKKFPYIMCLRPRKV